MTQPQFVLGTAQIGSHYGRMNKAGHLSDADAFALLEAAYASGVRCFDTARAYGESEARIGRFIAAHGLRDLVVVTKLDPLSELAAEADARDAVRRSLDHSRAALRLAHLPCLLLHRAAHVHGHGGTVLAALRAAREAGEVGVIGVSVNAPDELALALAEPDLRHVQLPFNMLDRRWTQPFPTDRTMHVRSVFLQGLLADPVAADWPALPGYDGAALGSRLAGLARELGRAGPADLALAFVRAQPWANGLVLGIETPAQLAGNLALFVPPPLTPAECGAVAAALTGLPAALVMPWLWPAARR